MKLEANPRSRSARLRGALKLAERAGSDGCRRPQARSHAAAVAGDAAIASPTPAAAPDHSRTPPHRANQPSSERRRLVGRSAHVVGRLPESAAVRRISGSRLWIAVIGVLLIGIVAINVLTVSYGAMASGVETNIETLERQNSILEQPDHPGPLDAPGPRARRSAAGMVAPATDEITYREFGPEVFAAAAQRLAAEGG